MSSYKCGECGKEVDGHYQLEKVVIVPGFSVDACEDCATKLKAKKGVQTTL